jgi:hypothetical protein
MPKQITKAEEYVLAKLASDALYASLTVEEKREADLGMHWATTFGAAAAPKPRGRPRGSKTKRPVNGAEAPPIDAQGVA